jgi:hypothetical protein
MPGGLASFSYFSLPAFRRCNGTASRRQAINVPCPEALSGFGVRYSFVPVSAIVGIGIYSDVIFSHNITSSILRLSNLIKFIYR